MRLFQSIPGAEEISVYLQKGAHSSPKGILMTKTAKFEQPKPCALLISDDVWNSLRLRVDLLA